MMTSFCSIEFGERRKKRKEKETDEEEDGMLLFG